MSLFKALRSALGKLPFIAEDLGYITPEVHHLRRRLEIPGMKILQFGFGNPGAHAYLPHKYDPDCVVYTGTHDNDTTVGWWNTGATADERELASAYLGIGEDGVNWAFIRAALASVANLCVIPVQDVLGLGQRGAHECSQRNRRHWSWRLRADALTPELAKKMAILVEITDRDVCVKAPSSRGEQSQRESGERLRGIAATAPG